MSFKALLMGALFASLAGSAASAATITIVSDGSTLAGAAPAGDPAFATGDTTGVTFGADVVGALGSFAPVPTGSPPGVALINIGPGPGASGFFETSFTLPAGFTAASLSGAGDVDDAGVVFLNGYSVGYLTEYASRTFATDVAADFRAGQNTLLVSDDNALGGPSGAAFYATVTYGAGVSAAPEPAAWASIMLGVAVVGVALRRGARERGRLRVA